MGQGRFARILDRSTRFSGKRTSRYNSWRGRKYSESERWFPICKVLFSNGQDSCDVIRLGNCFCVACVSIRESDVSMKEPIAYLKGEFVPASECVLPIYDLGIVLGAAVTDFLRTFNQKPFRMEEHLTRFYRSCRYARIQPPVDFQQSVAISEKLLAENSAIASGEELGLVYYMTAGENLVYAGAAGVSEERTPSYIQHTFPMRFHLWRDQFLQGVHCAHPHRVTGLPSVCLPKSRIEIDCICGSGNRNCMNLIRMWLRCIWISMAILRRREDPILSFTVTGR